MSCECEDYDCIEAWVNPCNTGTELNIVANQTGTWLARLEFNGMFREFGVEVTSGEKIAILTELLNESYVHELKLYNVSDTLVGCYNVSTHLSLSTPNAPVPPVDNDTWQWATVDAGSTVVNTVTDDLFAGDISPIIWLSGNPLSWAANGVTHVGSVLNFTSIGGVSGLISFQYKNLP